MPLHRARTIEYLRHADVALAEEALRVQGGMDWTHFGKETSRRRQTCHGKQYSRGMRRARALFSTVMRDIPGHATKGSGTGLSDLDVLNRLWDRCWRTGPVEWRLPKGLDAEGSPTVPYIGAPSTSPMTAMSIPQSPRYGST